MTGRLNSVCHVDLAKKAAVSKKTGRKTGVVKAPVLS